MQDVQCRAAVAAVVSREVLAQTVQLVTKARTDSRLYSGQYSRITIRIAEQCTHTAFVDTEQS
eukprot:13918-Heterococcus_DN1.PRE.1